MQLAHEFKPVHDGRIYIEVINAAFLYKDKGTLAEYLAGMEYAIDKERA